MNDQELKNLFKSLKHGEPSEIEMARWKRSVFQSLKNQSPKEWTRLAAACLLGVVIGATSFRGEKNTPLPENVRDDATIEHIYVNLR